MHSLFFHLSKRTSKRIVLLSLTVKIAAVPLINMHSHRGIQLINGLLGGRDFQGIGGCKPGLRPYHNYVN